MTLKEAQAEIARLNKLTQSLNDGVLALTDRAEKQDARIAALETALKAQTGTAPKATTPRAPKATENTTWRWLKKPEIGGRVASIYSEMQSEPTFTKARFAEVADKLLADKKIAAKHDGKRIAEIEIPWLRKRGVIEAVTAAPVDGVAQTPAQPAADAAPADAGTTGTDATADADNAAQAAQ